MSGVLPAWVRARFDTLPPLWRDGLPAAARGLAVGLLALTLNPVLFVLSVVSLALIPVAGLGFAAFPVITAVVRWRANLSRRLAAWSGVPIAAPYRPVPTGRPVRHLAAIPLRGQRSGHVARLRVARARCDCGRRLRPPGLGGAAVRPRGRPADPADPLLHPRLVGLRPVLADGQHLRGAPVDPAGRGPPRGRPGRGAVADLDRSHLRELLPATHQVGSPGSAGRSS